MNETKEQQRLTDTVTYIISLVESARRFATGLDPFDFSNINVIEAMYNRNISFLEDENVSYKQAHENYVQYMLMSGWTIGPEDYDARTMPDLVRYEELSQFQKEAIAFRAAMICSTRGFYQSLKADLETDFMDNFKGNIGILQRNNRYQTILM